MANESSEFPTLGFLFSMDIQCAKKKPGIFITGLKMCYSLLGDFP